VANYVLHAARKGVAQYRSSHAPLLTVYFKLDNRRKLHHLKPCNGKRQVATV
jgi:hypothetical protein